MDMSVRISNYFWLRMNWNFKSYSPDLELENYKIVLRNVFLALQTTPSTLNFRLIRSATGFFHIFDPVYYKMTPKNLEQSRNRRAMMIGLRIVESRELLSSKTPFMVPALENDYLTI